ncbi:DUF1460 domain-containing protein [candidate division WOR-3 bacterium]|nr:DUF1460 domain-containing protein [candidate division WOR-3 bacterium]
MASLTQDSLGNIVSSVNSRNMNVGERIAFYSGLFIGTQYKLGPLGEGEGNPPDTDPLFDFSKVDCVTFCEQVIALSMTRYDINDFLDILTHIRYRQGLVSFENRNHYSCLDWIPNNSWFCYNVTDKFHSPCTSLKIIDRDKFLSEHGFYAQTPVQPSIVEVSYIPQDYLGDIPDFLENGDLIMIATLKPGIDIAHWGFYIKEKNVFRHASMSRREVTDLDWDSFVSYIFSKNDFIGVSVVRIYETPFYYWREDGSEF